MNDLCFTDLDKFKDNVEEKILSSDSLITLIDEFEDYFSTNQVSDDYRIIFYRVIVDKMNSSIDFSFSIKILLKIYSKIVDLEILNIDSYLLKIDTIMILGIQYFQNKQVEKSKKKILEAIQFGEKYIYFSKENYYDALNCAYSWMGYYYYQDGNLEEALTCFKKILSYDEEVKDDPNYYVKEENSVSMSRAYIEEIAEKSSN